MKYERTLLGQDVICGADCCTDHRLVGSKFNPICTATTMQESAKETGCLQAETRQQETSVIVSAAIWYVVTQFRGPRREQDSLSKHDIFFSCSFPRTNMSQTHRLV